MKIKQGNIAINIENSIKHIQEGLYDGVIKNVSLKLDQSTPYGFKNILYIEVEINLGITTIIKSTSFYISDNVNSRFFKFISDMELDKCEEFDIDKLINERVTVTIENTNVNGITYSNINKIVPYETNKEVLI
ncbi:TPA: hypothetical protein KQW76_002747 [Clostridioides difficile]|nr:hypothetical protein [Clostridioides difficile]EJA6689688.1 hypothetical protein [Clostridioides difficile]EQH51477.1 hypothetical protein QMG_3588 [Clostridioides difficile DA00256]MBJ9760738.1 hypothetical protein [Clostridioides difficile]MCA0587057.1 hypothetical protein [Clostridioides difficile]MDO0484833.1 hypothetical protein [Clostridioides difficile]